MNYYSITIRKNITILSGYLFVSFVCSIVFSESKTIHSENMLKLIENKLKLSENILTLSENLLTLSDNSVILSENKMKPSENITTPLENDTTPSENTMKPSENSLILGKGRCIVFRRHLFKTRADMVRQSRKRDWLIGHQAFVVGHNSVI